MVECGRKWGAVGDSARKMAPNGALVGDVEQMFLGRFEHTIDDKGRLTIPSRYRTILSAGVVVTRGIDGCLFIFPIARWEQLSEKLEQFPTLTQDESRSFVRFFFTEAIDCVPDKQGRILIPTYLREYAQLRDTVIVAGVRDHLEVWNPEAYALDNARLEKEVRAFATTLSQQRIL